MEKYLTTEEEKFEKELEESFPTELLLLKELDLEEYRAFMKKITYSRQQVQMYGERMNKFIELAAEATGRPYIIDTGSNLDVADALFEMTDEWLKKPKKPFWKRNWRR